VEHPQLDRRDARLGAVLLAAEDELAVGGPGGRAHVAVLLRRQRARVLAVGVDEPQVVDATAIRGERDRLAVRREARLRVPGRARGQGFRLAARDRQRPQVAEQVEGDRAAVGRDVEREPRALARLERDRAGLRVRRVDVGCGVLRRGRCGCGGQQGEGKGELHGSSGHPRICTVAGCATFYAARGRRRSL
jgi:hypothetical protein